MNLQDFFENIDRQQQRVKQLPADFQPPKTSPQLSGPYPGKNATRGYLVGEGEDSLAEFAPGGPDGGGGDDGFDKETLRRMAAEWNVWFDPRIKRALAAAGWEIGQDEGYDDEPGVFVVQSGDVNGHSFMSWPAHELRQLIDEATGDQQFDDMMRKIKKGTKKQATADRRERERQSREQARAAFGPSPADRLSIRPDKGISEMDSQGYRGHRGDEDPGKGPEKSVQPAKAKDVAKDAEKELAKAMDREHAKKKQQGVAEGSKEKTPGVALSKAYKKDFDGNKPGHNKPETALTGTYSKTGKPGGELKKKGVAEAGYNPLDYERAEQKAMDQERAEFKRDELAAELGGEEQRAQQIMSGTWYVIIDGQAWRREGQPVTFAGRDAARRAGQTIKQRNPGKIVTITTQLPAMREAAPPVDATAPTLKPQQSSGFPKKGDEIQWGRVNDKSPLRGQVVGVDRPGRLITVMYPSAAAGPGGIPSYRTQQLDLWNKSLVWSLVPRDTVKEQHHHWIYESHVDEEYDPAKERERWEAARAQFIRQREEAEERDRQRQAQKPSAAQSGRTEFVAPHGDAQNELRMFQAGSKPAAVINTPDVDIWNDIIRSGRYVVQRLLGQDGRPAGYVVGQPGEDERVEKIHALVQNASNRAHQGDFRAYENSNYHRWLGRLLGYPTDKIEAFIQNYFRDTPDRARARYDEDYVQAFREALAEGVTSEDVLSSMKRRLGDYLQDVATAIRKDPDLIDKIPQTTDQIGPAVRTMRTDDGHEIRIHGNEDDGFRISVRGRNMESRFGSLEEAEIATEMYMARRREGQAITDDYVQEKSEPNLRKTARTQRMMSQLRAKYPQAESDLEALLYDFRAGQRMDRQDINRLDSELDSDEAEIDRIRRDLDDLMRRRGMTEIEIVEAKKDACYNKVKSRYKVWPSAYASGALVQCRKKGAKNWGKKSQVNEGWRQTLAAMAAAGIMALSGGGAAQAAATDTNPNKITATIQIDGQTQIFDLSSKGRDVKEASRWLEQFLDSRGVQGWTASVERGVRGSGNYQRMNIDSQGGPVR